MRLKIELRSDLCAAVGKHYAAMIDLDTALDEYGIPFIPARRLKGCLREIAEFCLDDDTVNRLFGVSGSSVPGSLKLGNAFIENYEAFAAECAQKQTPAEKVTELFCSVRGETAIENDTAKENSLRYIRVVNMTSPVNKKPLAFFADVDFDETDRDAVTKCIGALRNIGYHRNRGLGLVRCSLEESNTAVSAAVDTDFENCECLRLTVRLDSELMLPDNDADHSGDCITGTMLLGAIAAKYVKKYGDQGFNDLFYSDVKFGALTPAVPSYENTTPVFGYTFPAPRYFAKIKAATEDADQGIHNIIDRLDEKKQFKPLKKGYISPEYGLIIPETKVVYHNANMGSEEKGLYMQHCLASGQYFSGTISGPQKKIKTIAELFFDSEHRFDEKIRFGRSKTAQYALCSVCELRKETVPGAPCNILSNGIAAYRLESDTYLTENGRPAVSVDALCKALGVDSETLRPETSIAAKTVSGYNAKRNMKNPQFPVIAAGSVLVFDAPSVFCPEVPNKLRKVSYIGEKQNEGYGKVIFIPDAANETAGNEKPKAIQCGTVNASVTELIERNVKLEKMQELGIRNASNISLNPSQIGRLTLMAKEADKAKCDKFLDFEKRVYSIKSASTVKAAKAFFGEKALQKVLEDGDIIFSDCSVPAGKDGTETIRSTVSDAQWEYVYKYVLTALTVRKYQLRKEGNDNE